MNPDTSNEPEISGLDLYSQTAMNNMIKQDQAESIWGQEHMALREGMLSVFVTGNNLSSIGYLKSQPNSLT